MERLIGTRLGKYELRAEIGRGGMGVVYEGYDPLLERRVAVKVLAPHWGWLSRRRASSRNAPPRSRSIRR